VISVTENVVQRINPMAGSVAATQMIPAFFYQFQVFDGFGVKPQPAYRLLAVVIQEHAAV
jgi:hypothetical protein